MATPTGPGWYPAPDGRGQQWWNGVGWSESRRDADGTTPGLPGYQAAPPPVTLRPVPQGAPDPYRQPAQVTLQRALNGTRPGVNPALVGLILGAVGLFVFPPLGIGGIVLGIVGLLRPALSPTPSARWMSIGAIVLGAIALIVGLVQLIVLIAGIASVDVELT